MKTGAGQEGWLQDERKHKVGTHLGPAGWFMNAWNRDAAGAAAAEDAAPDMVVLQSRRV